MPESELRTVGCLIDRYLDLRATRPPRSNGDDGERAAHIDREVECENQLAAAVAHYGPVVWHGQVWWGRMPPRVLRVNHTTFGGMAGSLPWPPRPTPIPPRMDPDYSPPEEKEVGFVSEHPQ